MARVGDTIALEVAPGSAGGSWTLTGTDHLCTDAGVDTIPFPLSDSQGSAFADLGRLCWKRSTIDLAPSSSDDEIVVFNRDGNPATVTVTKTK